MTRLQRLLLVPLLAIPSVALAQIAGEPVEGKVRDFEVTGDGNVCG